MNLQDIFDQLSVGEFSQLSIGGQEQGVVNESNWARILPHVNLGLTALFTRFNLRQGRLRLSLIPPRTTYPLVSDFALSNLRSPQADRFILDSAEDPFLDDLIKVEKVTVVGGETLSLNDAANPLSVLTPKMSVLAVPARLVEQDVTLPPELRGSTLEVVYRARHPRLEIPLGYFNPAREEVDLPESHLAALLYFIASRVHNPIGMVEEFHAGNSYAAKYEQECARLELQGVQIDAGQGNDRFERQGFC
ncbi:hypothetical protein [Xenophilus sp. Marseille-Q4582]|uniref:hypothetical protein n=1 Tax=Xenophilus sp. Marseille-Q4582 TaxID=2866600 RepID=UPI001CE4281E|nr:hypothetical protein [Xenophilus sp. Marseille-Q4582]